MKHNKKIVYGILIGIISTLFFISLGVILAINFRSVYYFDVSALDIVASSGFSKEVILENYNALIDYCSPFFRGDLQFPTLAASPAGLQHFAEVKTIFVSFYYIFAVTFVALTVVVYRHLKNKDWSFLKTSAITTLIVPILVGFACSINFDETFILFHKLFFRNDYWLFDPVTDPVINILPETFFLHCALIIIATVVFGSILQYIYYKLLTKKK